MRLRKIVWRTQSHADFRRKPQFRKNPQKMTKFPQKIPQNAKICEKFLQKPRKMRKSARNFLQKPVKCEKLQHFSHFTGFLTEFCDFFRILRVFWQNSAKWHSAAIFSYCGRENCGKMRFCGKCGHFLELQEFSAKILWNARICKKTSKMQKIATFFAIYGFSCGIL